MTQKRVKVIDFEPEHIALMEVKDNVSSSNLKIEKLKFMKERSIHSITLLCDERVVLCGGFLPLWPGVIACWMIPSNNVKIAALSACKVIKGYVDAIIEREDCHRVQTTSPDDEFHARWMKFLGMENEGVLRKYTPEQDDHCMYARVK